MAGRESNLDRLVRMRDLGAAGAAIGADDARHLAAWVDRAIAGNTSIDAGAKLADGWQAKARQRFSMLSNWWGGDSSHRLAAKVLRAELGRYVDSKRFDQHVAAVVKPTEGRDAELYTMGLRYCRLGRLASEETIRKDIAELARAKSMKFQQNGG